MLEQEHSSEYLKKRFVASLMRGGKRSTAENIVKKANKRMELHRRISTFGASWNELKNIYILYIRSLLEQSCTVWNSGLTEEDKQNLERVQKIMIHMKML